MFHLEEEIDSLKQRGLLRTLVQIKDPASNMTELDGRKIHLFCSNNYLGLADHPDLKLAATSAIQTQGVGGGASRLVSGNSGLYTLLEEALARFKSTESSLVFNSGYAANIGAIGALTQKNDLILSDRLNHASLVDGARLSGATFRVYRHKDIEQLKKLLSHRKKSQNVLIITDGIFSMDGDIAPLPEISALAEEYDAFIYLDDAHATGVLGPEGRGTCNHFNLTSSRIIQMGTLSKALGGFGGFIAGSDILTQYLVNKTRSFIYTTALPPAVLATALAALRWIGENSLVRKRLWDNTTYFKKKVKELGFDTSPSETPIIPIHIGDNENAVAFSQKLLEEGIYVPAIRPPTVPSGTSRLRISLMATHRHEQIDSLCAGLEKVGKELRLI